MSGRVFLVQPLRDVDKSPARRIVESAPERVIQPAVRALALRFAVRILRVKQVIADADVATKARTGRIWRCANEVASLVVTKIVRLVCRRSKAISKTLLKPLTLN